MPGLSDMLLDSGAARHVDAVHGETIEILTGPEAGKKVIAVRETDQDFILADGFGEDRRAKRLIRFRDSAGVPRLGSQDVIRTGDGKTWNAVRNPNDGYLSTDFELKEIASCDT